MKTQQYARNLCAAALNTQLNSEGRSDFDGIRAQGVNWFMPITKFATRLGALHAAMYKKYWVLPKN